MYCAISVISTPLIIPPTLSIPGLPPPTPIQKLGSNPNLSRRSRGLYIGNITDTNEQDPAEFFDLKMTDMNVGITLVVTCLLVARSLNPVPHSTPRSVRTLVSSAVSIHVDFPLKPTN